MTDYLELIRERGSGALDKKMGIEIIEASPSRLVGTMPVEGNTQPIGLLHGGANVVLAESLGSIGTQLHAGPNRRMPHTINLQLQELSQRLPPPLLSEKLCVVTK